MCQSISSSNALFTTIVHNILYLLCFQFLQILTILIPNNVILTKGQNNVEFEFEHFLNAQIKIFIYLEIKLSS